MMSDFQFFKMLFIMKFTADMFEILQDPSFKVCSILLPTFAFVLLIFVLSIRHYTE